MSFPDRLALESFIRDSGGSARDPDFSNTAHTDRIELQIGNIDGGNIDLTDVGIHRYVIFGKIRVRNSTGMGVYVCILMQRETDSPHDTSDELAPGGLLIHEPAHVIYCDDAPDADIPQLRINRHLGEHCAERM